MSGGFATTGRGIRSAALAAVVAFVSVFGAIAFGVRVPGLGSLPPFAGASALDYSPGPDAGFAPLDPRYVSTVLGLPFGSTVPRPHFGGGGGGGDLLLGGPTRSFPSVHPSVPFTNDSYSDPVIARTLPFSATTDAAPATRQQDEPRDCSSSGGTAWYRYDSPVGGEMLIANTSGSDRATVLGVFTSSGSSFQNIDCNSGSSGNSQVLFRAAEATTYYFQVAWAGRSGHKLVFNLDPLGRTERVPQKPAPNGEAEGVSVSADGRYVAFSSTSTNLVAESDRNCRSVPGPFVEVTDQVTYPRSIGCSQTYVYDRSTRRVEQVSVSSHGDPANAESTVNAISPTGRFVTFTSYATNLVPEKTNDDPSTYAIFVRDRIARTTRLVSVSSSGELANDSSLFGDGISTDGRYVSFHSTATNLVPGDTNGASDAFVRDMVAGKTERVSVSSSGAQADDASYAYSMSPDGRYILFGSFASNLVSRDTNGFHDMFVRDRSKGITELISVSSTGAQGDAVSGDVPGSQITRDGRYVVFASDATNLVPGDTNNLSDVFVRDRLLHRTIRASVSSSGEEGYERKRNVLRGRVTLPHTSGISLDGRFVVFDSLATGLSPFDTNVLPDVFVHDMLTGATLLVSTTEAGKPGNLGSAQGFISGDGHSVGFVSLSTDLVANDVNVSEATYVHDIEFGP